MTSARTVPRPALRPGVAVIPMEGAVQLRIGDEEIHVLRSDAPQQLERLLAALGAHVDSDAAAVPLSPEEEHLLDHLVTELGGAGLLAPERPTESHGSRIEVIGHAPSSALLASVLAEHDLSVSVRERYLLDQREDSPAVLVGIVEAPDLALQFALNDAACAARIPCLFVDLSHGRHATVGPFYIPGESACYRCLRARLHENTAAFAELRAAETRMLETGRPLPSAGCSPAHRHLVAGIAAGEVVTFLDRHRPLRTLNRAITVALEQVETWSEPVWRVPWCESCGSRGRG